MPTHKGKDPKGVYYQWGKSGAKYCGRGAKAKADKQGQAVYAKGYKGK